MCRTNTKCFVFVPGLCVTIEIFRRWCVADEFIREFRGLYETFRWMDSSLELINYDDYLYRKRKRMRIIELYHILEAAKLHNRKRIYIPRSIVVRPDPRSSRWFITYLQNPSVSLYDESYCEFYMACIMN
jgi:hypothetical protein